MSNHNCDSFKFVMYSATAQIVTQDIRTRDTVFGKLGQFGNFSADDMKKGSTEL